MLFKKEVYIYLSFMVLNLVFVSVGCNYNHTKSTVVPNGEVNKAMVNSQSILDYNTIHSQVIQGYCLNCHSNTNGNQGNLNLETYASVKINADRIYYRTIEMKNMPSVYNLKPMDYQLLKDWLEAGSPERANGQRPINLNGKNINWDFIQKEIFYFRCLECHSQPNPITNLDLENIEVVKSKITKIFEKTILISDAQDNTHQALSPNEKLALMKWISLGMPR
jgi:uncharacterized membrane protein